MKKILTLSAAALLFSIGSAARAATPQVEIAPQRVAFVFSNNAGIEVKKGGKDKPRPYPTPRPRRPGPREEPENGDD